ncbi:MAG: glycosyltransferase [Candidatus Heimdallarchaeota archaeon]
MTDKSLVSVIIPTKNSEATIKKCLESIKNQTYPNIEIIVVDSFSRDKTKKIAENYGARLIEINAKRSEARNIGAERARGEFIFFIDSDMELDCNVIEECVKKVREGYDAVISPEISVGEGFWARCKALEKLCYVGDDLIEGSRFFERAVFEAVNGYDPWLEAGEDWDLHKRIKEGGFEIARIKACIKHHDEQISLWNSMKKKYYYAKTIDKYIQKYPNFAKKQLTPFRGVFFRNWRMLVTDPIHALGLLVMKICEFGAGGLGFIKDKCSGNRMKHSAHIDYSKRFVEDRKKVLLDRFLTSGCHSVLDLGCGAGIYLPLLAKRGKYVVGLDLSRELCKLPKKLGFNVVRGDGMYLPFKNDAFDVIWASEIIEHLPALAVFDELERVAKKWIIATMPNPYGPNYRADSSHRLYYTMSSLKAYLKTRSDWNYKAVGLGIEWPAAPRGIKLPKFVKLLTFYLTFHMPWLAPTFCVIGHKIVRQIQSN